jgi:hypothetical protein
MVAILKILKTKSTTLSDDLFGQNFVSKKILLLRIDNHHHFWNWEPWGGVISAIALQWQF